MGRVSVFLPYEKANASSWSCLPSNDLHESYNIIDSIFHELEGMKELDMDNEVEYEIISSSSSLKIRRAQTSRHD